VLDTGYNELRRDQDGLACTWPLPNRATCRRAVRREPMTGAPNALQYGDGMRRLLLASRWGIAASCQWSGRP